MIEGMSQKTFDENEHVIRAAVKAITRNQECRKNFRIFELCEDEQPASYWRKCFHQLRARDRA